MPLSGELTSRELGWSSALNFFFYLVHMTLASLLGATWDTYRIGMINESTQTRRSKPDPEQSIEVIAVNMPGRKFRWEPAEVPPGRKFRRKRPEHPAVRGHRDFPSDSRQWRCELLYFNILGKI
jgi:hypothetical protein